MRLYYDKRLRTLARHLRKNGTKAEIKLWERLKGDQLGVRFLRQRPIGKYIVDFCSRRSRLVIEVDGDSHGFKTSQRRDFEKDLFLTSIGLRVLRFDDRDVLHATDQVVEDIRQTITRILSEKHPPFIKGDKGGFPD